MSQFVPTASRIAQDGIGALGDQTFVSEVVIVERAESREFFTLKGESLGVVVRNPEHVAMSARSSTQLREDHEREIETLSRDIQSHRFTDGTLLFIGERMADELAGAILLRQHMRDMRAKEAGKLP